ncbi:hypothetical protein [Bdellovibrio sp. HCB337]|uniref:hypothetical protein n=1 Tax=Bdellovibrio sp. HCB337 TaxID=3394358 RepID=UPI0039A75139
MLKRTIVTLSTLFSFTALAADPATIPNQVSSDKPRGVESVNAIEAQAKVVSIDKKKRTLKLKSEDGSEHTVTAGEEVQNFDKIKKGDTIRVSYLESLVWELKKGSKEPITVTTSSDFSRAAPGQKPGAVATEKVVARGVVTKVDTAKQSITVKGPENTLTLPIRRADIFKDIKVGDQIEATYSEAMAISVESVKK